MRAKAFVWWSWSEPRWLRPADMPVRTAAPVTLRAVYVTIDKSEVVDFSAPPTKVSVTNTAIADIVVVSPTRILINGKGMGETSLLVFYGTKVQGFSISSCTPPQCLSLRRRRPDRGASRGGASGRAIVTSALRPRCRGGEGTPGNGKRGE